jgi:site-specific DNA recombinase
VVIADGGLEIIWRDQGWQELTGELISEPFNLVADG